MRFRPLVRAWRAVLPDLSGWKRLSQLQRTLLILAAVSTLIFGIIGAIVANSASPAGNSLLGGSRPTLIPIRRADWNGVPLHPEADLLRLVTPDSSEYTVVGDAAAVGGWFEQAWTELGLRYDGTSALDGTAFRWFAVSASITSDPTSGFRASGHIFGFRRFGYAVVPAGGGRCTITLIRTN